MPTQPVVWACNVNVMVSPFTAYVTVYVPFDEDLVPEHVSEQTYMHSQYTAIYSRYTLLQAYIHLYILYIARLTSAHHSSIHVV